jgi:putative transposase
MFKYRLYPNKAQTRTLEKHLELCCITYNILLDHCKLQYKEKGKTPTQFELNNLLPTLKRVKPELLKIHSQILQNIAKRIKLGYENFYAKRKAGLKAGLPRFKKFGRYKSISYPQSGFTVVDSELHLSKIGNMRIRLHRPTEGKIKNLTVKRMPSGKWFACFSCIVEAEANVKPFKDVGIDVGLNSYAVLSDGAQLESLRLFRGSERRLSHLQKVTSRKERSSQNRDKANVKVARLHEKIVNRRIDFLHKASRKVANTYETVYVEDLKIQNMVRNHFLAKSINDASWGNFIEMIAYKAESAGGRLIKVNPRGTSQLCSRCGRLVEKTLSERTHNCPHCGLVLDRDLNAALNILARGREIGRELPEYTPVGEVATTQSSAVEQVASMNQEASLLVER